MPPALEPGDEDHTPHHNTLTVFPAKPSQALGVSQDKAGGLARGFEPGSGLNDGLSKSCSELPVGVEAGPSPLLGELWSTLGRAGRKEARQGTELGCEGRDAVA